MKTLIIGQGLAGTILAFKLLQKGYSITVIDDNNPQKASLKAGGMVNPIVFRRMTKSWLIDDLYPEFLQTTHELEKLLGQKLFYPKPIQRILGAGEELFWTRKYTENGLGKYITPRISHNPISPYIETPSGYGTVHKGGWYDIQTLITCFRQYLETNGLLIQENIDISKDLKTDDNEVRFNNQTYQKVILCQGSFNNNQQPFNRVKYRHTKGEILTLNSQVYNHKKIITKNLFILPIHNQKYKVGSTYAWEYTDTNITPQARNEIIQKLEKISHFPYSIIHQEAGIRPTTHDRRQVIGFLKNQPTIGILNGLGSKGLLLAPWTANQLIQKMEHNNFQIHPEVDVERYYKGD
ncbi:FAD-binding oxidoreductase [Marinilabilia salmonicolor]|uniref:Glycine/D-amino acid oxidase-like deaminating enzyme n=1 Tax=Marinilabilia salmonicolor TaxID=989 RepID=A0A368V0U2_9BACT|nr:FAD-dependent oxidoreductase [Marinilabilia salmonicolor]RCW33965.1 glycine/D-amino acid oxidase-like deaminating enzyme [Marinilabilia salmonicolor]